MRVAILLALLACAAPALAQPSSRPIRKTFPEPVLDPRGVTAEQAGLDLACDRRVQLPRAVPQKSDKAIAATGGRARIEDSKLHVAGRTFDAPPDKDDWIGYAYAGRYASADVDILLHHDHDSVGWVIIDREAGTLQAPHLPIPSPNSQLWVTGTDNRAPHGEIRVYAREAQAWKEVAKVSVEMACDLRWIDDATIGFRTTTHDRYAPPGPEQLFVLDGGRWVRKPF